MSDVVTSAPPLEMLLGPEPSAMLSWPDSELMAIVMRRLECVIARLCLDGHIPEYDWEDGSEMYRQVYMRLWLRTYGRALLRHGDHDSAIMMCSHLGVIHEIGREALQMTRSALRWDKRRR